MQIYDDILSKYFLPIEYINKMIHEVELDRQDLLERGYARTEYTELGLTVIGANIEDLAIKAIEVSERINKIRSHVNDSRKMFTEAVQMMADRERIVLFTYYKTGITLTTNKELKQAKEKMLDYLDYLQDKQEAAIKKAYQESELAKDNGVVQ